MNHRILLFFLLALSCSVVYGQNNVEDRLLSLFEKQSISFPQEKIYVHTDKPYYISGERIWLRAHVTEAISLKPVSGSRYVYVELINPLNSVVARVKIIQNEGSYHGFLNIPDDIPEGDYTLRSYTSLMQGRDENCFFTKNIRICNPQASSTAVSESSQSKSTLIPTPDDDFDVTFYPEGGSIIYGSPCNVAFKAMKSNGQSTDVYGELYNQDGTVIREFNSEHLGMGSFPLIAEKGKKYYAICTNNKGKSKRIELPDVVNQGYSLSVNIVQEKLFVSVKKTAESVQNENLYLLAHSRGAVHFISPVDHEKTAVLHCNLFPTGVLHILLYNSKLDPLSERLVFINHNDQAQVAYFSDKENYSSRSLVKNRVNLEDFQGEPLVGNFSVSITSDREVAIDSTSNIFTQLLLTSDLRGNIENPAYYFRNSVASEKALDLLMRIQGWRRYNISEPTKVSPSAISAPLEILPEISGIVKNTFTNKPLGNTEVTVLSPMLDYFDKTITDKNGRFNFGNIEWPDSMLFIVSAIPKSGLKNVELLLDEEKFPKRTLPSIPPARIDNNRLVEYAQKAQQKYIYENGARMIDLSEVTISARRPSSVKKSAYYSSPDNIITKENIEKSGATNVNELLLRIPNVRMINGIIFIGTSLYRYGGEEAKGDDRPLLIIDDVVRNSFNEIYDLQFSSIEQIDVFKGANPFGSRGGNGVVIVYTKRGEIIKDKTISLNVKSIFPLGYQKPAEFYAPKYDTPEKWSDKTPDLRTTIHWQPVVKTDDQGIASFEFYAADEATTYTVVIEGLADDGSIIYRKEQFFVR